MRTKRPAAVSSGRLACGCAIGFREGSAGSPVTVVVVSQGAGCGVAMHMAGVPVFDHRDALRPATRPLPPVQPDFEEEN